MNWTSYSAKAAITITIPSWFKPSSSEDDDDELTSSSFTSHSNSSRSSRILDTRSIISCDVFCPLFITEQKYSVSQKKNPPLRLSDFFSNFHKQLRIFNRFFTHLLYVLMYAQLQIFVQLSPTLTKLCHIMRDYLVRLICAKCPKCAKTRAFRRLRKSLIALLIVVSGKSL